MTIATSPGFLDAIIAEPADDAVRLIYADWLDENGEPSRAEFIRVQVELASMDRKARGPGGPVPRSSPWRQSDRRLRWLEKRERELFDAEDGGSDWTFAPQEGIPPRWLRGLDFIEVDKPQVKFSRGFVSAVQTDSASWLLHGPSIARVQPLESVTLSDWEVVAHADPDDFHGDTFTVHPSMRDAVLGLELMQVELRDELQSWGWIPTLHASPQEALAVFGLALVMWAREPDGVLQG